MKELFIQYVMPPVLTALGLGLAWLLTTLGTWATSRWKDSKVSLAIARTSHFAGVVVQDIEATLRPAMRAVTVDGKITPEEARHLKEAAMTRLKTMLGEQGLQELSGIVGVFAPSVDAYLSGVIEKRVAALHP